MIKQFHAVARVNPDASLNVEETITVYADGKDIRHGIFRMLPATKGEVYEHFSVSRDGKTEPYHINSSGLAETIYIGDSRKTLPSGSYTYKISYVVKNAVRFQDKFDELYWNVTGNEWAFPIEQVFFRVILPAEAEVVPGGISAYTGEAGAKGHDVDVTRVRDLLFVTTRPLAPKEGLTVSVAWNKGIVQKPSVFEENKKIILSFILIWVLLLFYYAAVWHWVGRDPKARVLRCFAPPENMSPAQVRYLYRMGEDADMLSVILISLIQKGFVKVLQKDKHDFTLTRLTPEADVLPSEEEKACMDALFEQNDSLPVSNTYASRFSKAFSGVSLSLKKWAGRKYFFSNTGYKLPCYLFTFVFGFIAVAVLAVMAADPSVYFIAFGFVFIMNLLQQIMCRRYPKKAKKIPFGWLTLLGGLFVLSGWNWVLMLIITVILLPGMIFCYLVAAYTVQGRKIMDEIEGFLQYMEVAETNRVFASDPQNAARIYCNYLPYAVALDIQNAWWRAFSEQLGLAAAEEAVLRVYGAGFADGAFYSNFSSAVGNARYVPSSSSGSRSGSGFDGGGCSGGGSGGGGGGGW